MLYTWTLNGRSFRMLPRRPQAWCFLVTLLVGFLAASPAGAQGTGTVSGRVVHAGTMEPMSGIQVSISGSRIGSLTDRTGRFILLNVPAGEVTVRAQSVGFAPSVQTVAVTVGETATLELQMRQAAIALDEVVVTGTGAPTERRTLGHTIATVDVGALDNAPVATISEILGGREPGVSSLPTGGLAGEGARIRIRGSGSLAQTNEPIIYVDGVRIDNASSMRSSRLDDINPAAIERIEILKGAAAATLYGTEASNGVIQIFTKRGRSGPPRWEYRLEQGFSRYSPNAWKHHAGFARTQEQADRAAGHWGLPPLRPFEVFEVDVMGMFRETGRHGTHSLSITGGGENITYYFGGRLANENGPFGGSELAAPGFDLAEDINSLRQANTNVTVFPRENLRVRVSGMYTERFYEEPGLGNSIFAPYSMALLSQPAFAHEGNPSGARAFMTIREGMQRRSWSEMERFGGSVGVNYEVLPSLTVDATGGVDVVNERTFGLRPFGYNLDGIVQDEITGGRTITDRNRRDVSFDAKMVWATPLTSDFTSSVVVGSQLLRGETHLTGGFGRDFPAPGLEVASAGAVQGVTDSWLSTVTGGVYAQQQIGYRDFAFMTLGGRYDRHSAFGEETGGALYPKVSLSVVPSDMPGWNNNLLSTLQLRGAIGQAGLQPGAFDRFTTFAPVRAEPGPGVQPANVGNPALRPEVSTEWEAGANMGLFNDRIALEGTYWNRSVSDLLVARQFVPSGGFLSTQLDNLGDMNAWGVEFGLKGMLVNTPAVSVNPFVNFSFLRETITDLGEAPEIKLGYFRYLTWHKVGFAPGSFFGPTLADLPIPITLTGDCTPATREQLLAYLSVPRAPENIRPIINHCGSELAGRDFLGKPTPDWSGSFGTDVNFLRNFTFTTMMEFKVGNYSVHNLGDAFRRSHALLGRNVRSAAEVEATLNNPESTAEQRFDAAMRWATEVYALSPFDGLNEVEKGDFLRWREASLTYNIPGGLLERFGMNTASLTFGARNLALFTAYSGIDPESNVVAGDGAVTQFIAGTNAWVMPLPRRFTLSANIGF